MNDYQKQLKAWQAKPFIKQLKKQLPQAEIFLVGGAVRDIILGRETKDFDFVIRNVSKKNLEKFLLKLGKVNLVGKKFGVFKFRPRGWQGEDIDIALPRTEHSIGMTGGSRDFKIQSNAKLKIEDDLSRRDFTINAMAWDINQSKLIDPFNGLSDLKNKIIKTVGKAELRFKEDYSRMLRAIRFAVQLNLPAGKAGFEIESKTWQTIKKSIQNLNKKINGEWVVAREIIAKELTKAISAQPVLALELLDKSNTLKHLMPELLKMKGCPQPKNFHSEGDVWQHTVLALKKFNSAAFKKEFGSARVTAEVSCGLIFHDIGKPYTITKADRLRFNNHDVVATKIFKDIAERLRLSAAGIKTEVVENIIAKHMLPVHAKVETMKDTTIEKYFFNENFPGEELLMLIFADISATVPPSGKPDFTTYKKLKNRINKLKRKSKGPDSKKLPRPLINGHDLMKELKLKSGPPIGKLLAIARETQLSGKIKTKKQALTFLKKQNRD